MAVLVDNQYDRFQLSDEVSIVEVPHYLGTIMIKTFDVAAKAGYVADKVSFIKFLREWHQEKYKSSLGLKDAKDIMDHYSTISSQMPYERRQPYKAGC